MLFLVSFSLTEYFLPIWGIFSWAPLTFPKAMVILFPFLSPLSLPFLLLFNVFYFCLSALALFLQPSCLHTSSPHPSVLFVKFSLLFIFSNKCCFHYFAIHSLHNLYKFTLVHVFLSVFHRFRSPNPIACSQNLALTLIELDTVDHPKRNSPLWLLWQTLLMLRTPLPYPMLVEERALKGRSLFLCLRNSFILHCEWVTPKSLFLA